MNPFDRWRHIVVEGPIGVGKTTLARKLADRFGAQLVLEDPQSNPFLERFYRDPPRYALPTQLFFLFQRVHQLRDFAQSDRFSQSAVSDFLFDKDPLFARLNLSEAEFDLYQKTLETVSAHPPRPDLVIYLQADPETLIERIRKRAIASEANIDETYLRALVDAYSRYFHPYDSTPLLIVNTAHLNPIDRDPDFDLLLQQIAGLRGRRGFINRAD